MGVSDSPHGLYLHIPYCKSICPYCDFNVYKAGRTPPFDALAQSMISEMQARAHVFCGPLQSVYFGGGTPSLMPVATLIVVLNAARSLFGLTPTCEITLEMDPGTVDAAYLAAVREAGINRLSIGWQSTHDTVLKTLGRNHNADAGATCVTWARAAGFRNISLDLIFAVPKQTLAHLALDLSRLVALAPQHVSLYALTYHAGTPMARRLAKGSVVAVGEDCELAMMDLIDATLTPAGLARYEVSNYAQAGYRSVHNSAYWSHTPYLGVGPGAHSFYLDGQQSGHRWAAIKRPEAYMAAWTPAPQTVATPPAPQDPLVDFAETLDHADLRFERIMLGLRQVDGFALDAAAQPLHSEPAREKFTAAVARLQALGWAQVHRDRVVPTPLGLLNADAAAALFC